MLFPIETHMYPRSIQARRLAEQSALELAYLAIRVVHSPKNLGCSHSLYDPLEVWRGLHLP